MTSTPAPPLLLGRLRAVAALGETRLSAVYRVVDDEAQTTGLLHLARPDLAVQPMLQQQFDALYRAGARHPALVQISQCGVIAGQSYALSEDLQGQWLAQLVPITPAHALRYLRQLVIALAETDSICPPISSRNVLVIHEGQVKLVDCWQVAPRSVLADLAHYHAPELRNGAHPGRATLIYALGILLFEMLTGQRPRAGSRPAAVIETQPRSSLPRLRDVAPELYLPGLEQLLATATAELPAERFASLSALQLALDVLLARSAAPTERLAAVRQLHAPMNRVRSWLPRLQSVLPSLLRTIGTAAVPADVRSAEPAGDWRDEHRSHHRRSSLLLIGLLLLVVLCSFAVASQLVAQLRMTTAWPGTGSSMPPLVVATGAAPDSVRTRTYVVNLAEGLNLRRLPGTQSAAPIITVIPNGSIVTVLDGPLTLGATSWVRVRVESQTEPIEGWMALTYLVAQP